MTPIHVIENIKQGDIIMPAYPYDFASGVEIAIKKECQFVEEDSEELEPVVLSQAAQAAGATSFDHPSLSTPPLSLPVASTSNQINTPDSNEDLSESAALQRKKRKNKSKHKNQTKKRRVEAAEKAIRPVRPEVLAEVFAKSSPITTTLQTGQLPVARCGYIAKNQRSIEENTLPPLTLEHLVMSGYKLIEWDGRTPRPLCDDRGRIFAVLAGQPLSSSSWGPANNTFHDVLMSLGKSTKFSKAQLKHRRGYFPAYDLGVVHGKGTKEPVNLKVHPQELEEVLEIPHLQRMAGFASCAFKTWAPNLFNHYQTELAKLYTHEQFRHLKQIFPSAPIFPSMSVNAGPRAFTTRHRDSMNLPFGWCAIQSLGRFDCRKGGHLVLDDVGLVIQFPPNSVVLIPSATIMHSNLPISTEEERSSVTFFCAGGLFRFIDTGFRTEKSIKEEDEDAYDRLQKRKEGRWEMGINLYSMLKLPGS